MGIDVASEIAVTDTMVSDRSTTENTWQEIRNNMQPDDANFLGIDTPGTQNRADNLDSTAEDAGEITSSALHNSLSNPATRWFDLEGIEGRADLDDDDRLWLNDATSDLLGMFDSGDTGFSAAQKIKYRGTVFYGMAPVFMEEKFGVGIFFQAIPLREVYVREGPDGRINEVRRVFTLTAQQAVKQFDLPNDKPGKDVLKNNEKPETNQEKTKFVHITRERLSIPEGIGPLTMPIESVYINMDDQSLVRESGYPEWPWSIPRWFKRAGEVYGRGLGHKTLSDVKMSNRISGATIESLEKNVDPALQAPDDGVMGQISLARGGITWVRPDLFRHGDPIRPLRTGGQTTLGIDYLDRLDRKIKDGFLNNLISISDDPRMSATQAVILDQNQADIIGPIVGSFESEDLDPMVNRALGIGIRSGRIRPPTENLQGKTLKIVYTSPLARRRRSGEIAAIGRTFAVLAPMAEIEGKIWDNFDFDETARIVAGVEGVPPGVMRPINEVLEKRKVDKVAAAKNQQLEDAAVAAKAAGDAAPALKVIQGGSGEAA